jgi:Glycoside hydrolase family 44
MSRCEKIVSMNWQSSCRRAAQFAVRFFLRFMLWLPVPARLSEKKLKLNVRWLAVFWLLAALSSAEAQNNQTVYTDSLQNGWADWSYFVTKNFSSTNFAHSGSMSISVTLNQALAYGALSLEHANIDTSIYTNLTFWINGGPVGGQLLQVYAESPLNTGHAPVSLPALTASGWQQITLSLSSLGVANQPNFSRFSIQDRSGSTNVPTYYVDDISLQTNGTPPPPPITNILATISVDAQASRHPINPLIYGVAFASSSQLSDLNSSVNRSGGNSETRYNWQLNAHNHAADWFFESIPDATAIPADSADSFVTSSKNGGAQPMLTIPMIGWAPKLTSGRSYLASYSIAKYGPQTAHDTSYSAWFDFGNGIGTNSVTHTSWAITTNDATDANFPTNSAFQQAFVQHLTNRWGLSTNGGVRYFLMDNEHSLWQETHRDVHPVGPTMQEIRDDIFDYAGMVKSLDPSAMVCAPEEWGWPGYFNSGYDIQNSGSHDRNNNGGWDYMPWLLDQIRQHDALAGHRLLDYFTLHCYPQGGESGNDVSTSIQTLRNRSTRQFWDTNYVDASWINQIVKLIPRMKDWVAAYYPGTKIGVTEYNWGAEDSINGATAQADIFGIFGREGLDLATRWTTPDSSTPTFKAMKMYRNYDGNKSTFGDTSVSAASGTNADYVSAFAAWRSGDGALTAMVINKQLTATATAIVTLTNFPHAHPVQVWQLTSANAITRLSDVNVTGNTFTNVLPAQSITLFVSSAAPPPMLRVAGMSSDNLNFWLDGQAGQRYWIQNSTNLTSWATVQTNLLVSDSTLLSIPATAARGFFRAVWAP